ncbi:hypothetical protein GF359_07355 [candidate division WOR-3 bacterium]|uniref:VOC domain-containing protein n=1 Tax=candidate division WOR-3 bacterium TaxID=2052148 RepID=A0A9D5KC56_UNCW3|nr:hypothetical protein [candidate division WOR-3 bacterium]MBD3365016.1 hypothetical protein [candidate division WOR-3 bacterium]
MIKRIWSITLTVSNLARSLKFYKGLLGLTEKYRFGDYAGFDCGGVEIGLKTWGNKEKPREGEPCLDLLVDDVDAVTEDLKSKGVSFSQGPEDTKWGSRTVIFTDPDGNRLQLTQIDWGSYFQVCSPSR